MIESIICNTSSMDQTTQIKIEFFELIRLLNQSNLNTNQKTEVLFFIETTKGKSILFATTNKISKIQLIFKNEDSEWRKAGFSSLNNLEEKLVKLLNTENLEKIKNADLTKKIRSLIFKNFDQL